MVYRDDDGKEREDGNVAEAAVDEVLDETTEDEDDLTKFGDVASDDEKGWE